MNASTAIHASLRILTWQLELTALVIEKDAEIAKIEGDSAKQLVHLEAANDVRKKWKEVIAYHKLLGPESMESDAPPPFRSKKA